MHRIGNRTLLRRGGATLAAAVGAATLVMGVFATPVTAGGNPHFENILKGAVPYGFPVSPAYLDISSGPQTLHFNEQATNLTDREQNVALKFTVSHILTYNGVNVADGQPGQPGITFHGPQGTTQQALPGTQSFTVTFQPSQSVLIQRTWLMTQCGYYQVDIWAPVSKHMNARGRETLASGFTRVLGCSAGGPSPTPTPSHSSTPTPTPTHSAPGGTPTPTSSVPATVNTPSTGSGNEGLTLAGAGLLIGGLALFGAGVGSKRRFDVRDI